MRLQATLGEEGFEVYDYPGAYVELTDGERQARLLLEAEEAERQIVRGESDVAALTPGYHFTLHEHYRRDTNGKYIVTAVEHSADTGSYRAWEESAALSYTNTFTCIPDSVPYRPPRRTHRPVIHGAQTAVVVGPTGEEVYVDSYGRIKVQFHWDRDGKRDENSSCGVRVATPWGGKGYGSVSIPRIGNEVIVAFEEGDPDRPLVMGSVYNADQMPPFKLPDSGIQMGMKSRSSPGGGGDNEISLMDSKGKEMISIHARYDMYTTVDNDETHVVHNNRTTTVDVDHTTTVSANQKLTVSGDEENSVAGDRSTSVGGSDSLSVGSERSMSSGAAMALTAGAGLSADAAAKMALSSGADTTVTAGANLVVTSSADASVAAGGKVVISGGATIEITAGSSITLTAGGASIEIGGGNVKVNGPGTVELIGAMVKNNC